MNVSLRESTAAFQERLLDARRAAAHQADHDVVS